MEDNKKVIIKIKEENDEPTWEFRRIFCIEKKNGLSIDIIINDPRTSISEVIGSFNIINSHNIMDFSNVRLEEIICDCDKKMNGAFGHFKCTDSNCGGAYTLDQNLDIFDPEQINIKIKSSGFNSDNCGD